MSRWVMVPLICLMLLVSAGTLRGADEAAIQAAIQKGRNYLQSRMAGATGGEKSIAAYALLKTGTDKSDPVIQDAIDQVLLTVEEHYAPGKPRFGKEFAYTVPTHLFLLEAADPVLYKPQLEALAGYLVENQQPNGSWYYSVPEEGVNAALGDCADTSQAQFALLGLWAAQRAGVEIAPEVWRKAGTWFLNTQLEDGGFVYQPFARSKHKPEVTLSVTLAGTGSLALVRHIFYPGGKLSDELAQVAKPKKKHGVLDRIQDQQEKQRKVGNVSIPVAALDKGIARGMKLISNRFGPEKLFQIYLYYAMERLAALLDSETIGQQDWYAYVSDDLVLKQTAEGFWSDQSGNIPATAFGILCLNRATAKIIGRTPHQKKVGGGLLAGARGLPTDLSKLQLKDGQAVERKSKGNVDDLLAELEKTQNVSVADVQKALLESVDLDDPEKLVGELDRLKRLAVDPRAEVRRTALWAIGRTGDVRLAPLLIAALRDAETDVIREASFALTVLARKPTGIVDDSKTAISIEPLHGVEEDATEEAIQTHLKHWQSQAEAAWNKWYLSVRPYQERDDRRQLQRKK